MTPIRRRKDIVIMTIEHSIDDMFMTYSRSSSNTRVKQTYLTTRRPQIYSGKREHYCSQLLRRPDMGVTLSPLDRCVSILNIKARKFNTHRRRTIEGYDMHKSSQLHVYYHYHDINPQSSK